MKNKILCMTLIIITLCSTMMGCSGSAGDEETKNGGKHLNYGAAIYGTSFEPSNSYDSWELMRYGIGECLVKFDEEMNAVPWLAKSWKMKDDQLTWEFTLQDGIKFSDGSDMTASAVKASIERLFNKVAKGATAEVNTYFTYESIIADDESNTITIVTTAPTPDLPGSLAYPWCAIISAEAEKAGAEVASLPICTGPYAVESFDAATGTELVKNEYYWDGEVGYDSVSMKVIQDSTTRSMALQSGDIDVASYITYADMPTFLNDTDKYEVHEIASARTAYMYINQAGALGNDSMRQAIMLATDNETMCDVTVGGSYIYGAGIIPSTLDYGTNELKNPYEYNVNAAAKLLDEAGIIDSDGDGYRELDGKNIDINLQAYENRSMDVFAEAVQLQLKEIGIKVSVTLSDSATVVQRQREGKYDMACYNTLTTNTGDPANFLGYWYSKSEANCSGYSNPEYDAIFEELSVEFKEKARKEDIKKLQQILVDDAAVYVCGYYMSNTCNRSNVAGVQQVLADFYWITKDLKPAE
jgi:peptide/nickel transport system substrate-binding protein